MPCKSAKPDVLEQRITVPGVNEGSSWWHLCGGYRKWERAERPPHTDTPVQSNYTATKSRLSKGTMGEVDRRSCPSSLPGPVVTDNSLLLTLSIGLLSARRLMASAIVIFAIQLCIIVRIHTPYEKRLNSPCIQDERARGSRV